MAKPLLSLCLIARDEEEMLPACLASVRGVADEIVLVDTGSKDRTVALAREAGARVLEHRWNDDFAAPRNLAAAHATGEWLLVLDADERLARPAGAALRGLAGARGFDLGMVRVHNARRADAPEAEVLSGEARYDRPALLPRVIRNTGDVTWRGAVHESVGEWLLARGGKRRALEVDVLHYGYVPGMLVSRAKRERNIALLRKRWAESPDDVTPAGYLALELLEAGEHAQAAEVLDRAWPLLPRQPKARCVARITVARGLLALRVPDPARTLEAAAAGEAHNGPHPDFAYLRGFAKEVLAVRAAPRTPERGALLAEAEAGFRDALALLGQSDSFEFLGAVNEVRALLHLGIVHLLQGRAGDGLNDFAAALKAEPANASARVGAAEALLDVGEPARALAAVEPALGKQPDGWLVAACAAERLGAKDDARLFLSRARERLGGYECLHRWARHEALEKALG